MEGRVWDAGAKSEGGEAFLVPGKPTNFMIEALADDA